MQPHAVKSYLNHETKITHSLEAMGELVAQAIQISGEAILQRDQALRDRAKANSKQLLALQQEVDSEIAAMFSRHSPMASELRMILSAHKIANALERMGELAKNTTKRLVRSEVEFGGQTLQTMQSLVLVSESMLKDALKAFNAQDEALARAVWLRDDEADTLCREIFGLLLKDMCAVPGKEAGMVDALFAVKQWERMADYATYIAKTVIYVTTGTRPRKKASQS